MQTFAKLPTTRPSRHAVISKAGVLNSSDQSGAGIPPPCILGVAPGRVKAAHGAGAAGRGGGLLRSLPVRALLLVGLLTAALFVGLMLWTTGGLFVAQVSDLYVIAQYARAMAEGHPFRYNPGEAPTTGATSLLHTVGLAVAHAAGAGG